MKRHAAYSIVLFCLLPLIHTGCKNPCKSEIDGLRTRVDAFLEDSDPLTEGDQPCVVNPNDLYYDQICDYAVKALDTRWPYFDCNSCDAAEIRLCACYPEWVWTEGGATTRRPLYPGMVFCLANYYRIRSLCECDPAYAAKHGDNCNITGGSVYPGAIENCKNEQLCDDHLDQNCDGIDPRCASSAPSDQEYMNDDRDDYCSILFGDSDCNDDQPSAHPGGTEICDDDIDQDCNGEDLTCDCPDADQDRFKDASCGGNDCDDSNPRINPAAREVCKDECEKKCRDASECVPSDTACLQACDDACPEMCDDGIDQDCNGHDLLPGCFDLDNDGYASDTCGGSDCHDEPYLRICAGLDRPQVKQHNMQQTDMCDAVLSAFSCGSYDGDSDGIPDQYDGGQSRDAVYNAETPECVGRKPPINKCIGGACAIGGSACSYDRDCTSALVWEEFFRSPKSLYRGGLIYIEATGDGTDDDTDKDGVADSCDNCKDVANGFDCAKVVGGTQVFSSYCDINGDGTATPSEIALGAQKDSNNDGVGDACDRDSDGMLDAIDNCPDKANGNECDVAGRDRQCDVNGDGLVTDEEMALGSQKDTDQDGVGDACDNCPDNPNGRDCNVEATKVRCDVNSDGNVTADEIALGNQKDSDDDGIGDACDPD